MKEKELEKKPLKLNLTSIKHISVKLHVRMEWN